ASARPVELTAETILARCGTIPLSGWQGLQAAFPTLARVLGADRLAALVATTRVVGMECPGLHSLYAGLKANFSDTGDTSSLRYAVVRYDPRFRRASMELSGG